MQLVWVIVVTRESQVVFSVEPDLELWLPLRDAYPLADVELALLHDERALYVLLRHPNLVHAGANVLDQIVLVRVDLDAAASGFTARLDDPRILGTVETELVLTHGMLQLVKHRNDSLLRVLHADVFDEGISLQKFQVPWSAHKIVGLPRVNHVVVDLVGHEIKLV